jgi:Rubisco Assembly chaperone C-terminal domain/Rubisco accumulation factor 1 alpha helical domain/Rubisco accumulation factor 1 helix turn helix domain
VNCSDYLHNAPKLKTQNSKLKTPTQNSMTTPPSDPSNPLSFQEEIDVDTLLLSLRRKEGTWKDWGKACQLLQKAGYTPQQIFEASGLEPIQQNQIVVATQVYNSILEIGTSEAVQQRFDRTGSDTLYELRILSQSDRAAAATLIVAQGIDSEGSKEVAKALKDFSRLSSPPAAFPTHPGDAVAYHFWRLARQQGDLQMRSRLIAQGLRFASSDSARQHIEKLLTDFTITRSLTAPRLPFYRLETESEVPKILPVAGRLPLTAEDLKAVPMVEEEGAFAMVKFSGTGAFVPIPGWQVVLNAEDPVVVLGSGDRLPSEALESTVESPIASAEEVLILIDRAERTWDQRSYFIVEEDGQLQINWFETAPSLPILGKVLVIMRPRKVLDEDFNKDMWQIEE